jgi:hypothetical protein
LVTVVDPFTVIDVLEGEVVRVALCPPALTDNWFPVEPTAELPEVVMLVEPVDVLVEGAVG